MVEEDGFNGRAVPPARSKKLKRGKCATCGAVIGLMTHQHGEICRPHGRGAKCEGSMKAPSEVLRDA